MFAFNQGYFLRTLEAFRSATIRNYPKMSSIEETVFLAA